MSNCTEAEAATAARPSVRVKMVSSGQITLRQVDATSSLTPEYEHARGCIDGLVRASESAKHYAWRWLLTWRNQFRSRFNEELPAPWIFADENGVIEFEWHMPLRHLVLSLGDEVFEYSSRSEAPERRADEEGTCAIDHVADKLAWVTGESAGG